MNYKHRIFKAATGKTLVETIEMSRSSEVESTRFRDAVLAGLCCLMPGLKLIASLTSRLCNRLELYSLFQETSPCKWVRKRCCRQLSCCRC